MNFVRFITDSIVTSSVEHFQQQGFNVVQIPLAGEKKLWATIDIEDAPQVLLYRWQAVSHKAKDRWTHYAYIRERDENGKWITLYMHRLFLGLTDERIGDHVNRETLDYRRKNLRIATVALNAANKTPIATRHGLPKGVRLDRRRNRKGYGAQINVNGKVLYLGYYYTPEAAGDAYDEAALRLHGEFAVTNKMLRELAAGKKAS